MVRRCWARIEFEFAGEPDDDVIVALATLRDAMHESQPSDAVGLIREIQSCRITELSLDRKPITAMDDED